MKLKMLAASAIFASMLLPLGAAAQSPSQHERYVQHQRYLQRRQREREHARYVQERHDAHHHTKAKIVGGSAIGGAVIGGLLGGPKGAVIGAGVGAGGGLIANHERKDHDIKKRERDGRY